VVVAACAVAVAFVLVGAGCSGDGDGRVDLAFVSSRDGDYAIHVMDASGGDERRLTDSPTSNPTTPNEVFFQIEPAWSPDATRIAFSSRREGTFDLYAMDADGSETVRLTSTKEHDSHPTWSTDGRQIAFARDGDIFVMGDDGSDARRVSDPQSEDTEPSWSPDGEWIAYVRRTPGTTVRELWLMRPDGSDRRKLTDFASAVSGPAWSPGSRRIAFAAALDGSVYDIYSVGRQGGGLRRHTQSPDDAFEPSWSPDGRTIAFSRGGAIVTVDSDGRIEEVTDPENNDSSPAWNPNPPDEEES
jgi:TolB protein